MNRGVRLGAGPLLFGKVGLLDQAPEERLHALAHFFWMKLYAEERGVLVFEDFDHAVRRSPDDPKTGRHIRHGLNMAGV